jgi:hypothetical protein
MTQSTLLAQLVEQSLGLAFGGFDDLWVLRDLSVPVLGACGLDLIAQFAQGSLRSRDTSVYSSSLHTGGGNIVLINVGAVVVVV